MSKHKCSNRKNIETPKNPKAKEGLQFNNKK